MFVWISNWFMDFFVKAHQQISLSKAFELKTLWAYWFFDNFKTIKSSFALWGPRSRKNHLKINKRISLLWFELICRAQIVFASASNTRQITNPINGLLYEFPFRCPIWIFSDKKILCVIKSEVLWIQFARKRTHRDEKNCRNAIRK